MADQLPPHKQCDFQIKLVDGFIPKVFRLMVYSIQEYQVICNAPKKLNFGPKETGEIRQCADYRSLNLATISDRYPLLISSKHQDLASGKCDNEKYSSFCTIIGCADYTVIPFGLRNAPAFFKDFFNQ
ncbi:unnamed protein product [Rotaria socialis]|uniref:Uncharacterized protein n=1 Tax=Rotaria socialis TaxID=392032 RepID=A0A821PKM8_9BILA|nr:unnamed protein product [Rotaria socialis]